ncbi:MAG TPA: hypothetical protein DEA51_00975 [Erysipelotrichaceae bacterium]|nr:hypothetical protein [Erysipelotrichaceae bacterium]
MIIECLFPSVASLFGEHGNITYLKQTFPQATVYETDLSESPRFLSEKVDLVYMGPMSERAQRKIIDLLMPYRLRIKERMDEGNYFLITGNAVDIFGTSIEYEDVGVVKALDLFPFTTKLKMLARFNCMVMGEFEHMTLVGHKTQFSMSYGDFKEHMFFKVSKGIGMNSSIMEEGIRYHNFFATQMIGPMFVLNPHFTQWFFNRLANQEVTLPYKEALLLAYEQRVKDFTLVNEAIYE